MNTFPPPALTPLFAEASFRISTWDPLRLIPTHLENPEERERLAAERAGKVQFRVLVTSGGKRAVWESAVVDVPSCEQALADVVALAAKGWVDKLWSESPGAVTAEVSATPKP